MLVDPSGNRLISSSAITAAGGKVQDVTTEKFEYLVEVADPSEDPANAYMIDEVLVSDFYTPHFFDPVVSPGVRYSFTGRIKRPREILPGGYISWLNPALGTMQQLRWFGTPEVIDLPGHPAHSGRGTLRGFVDENTRPPLRLSRLDARSYSVTHQQQRAQWLRKASALRTAAYAFARRPRRFCSNVAPARCRASGAQRQQAQAASSRCDQSLRWLAFRKQLDYAAAGHRRAGAPTRIGGCAE